MFLTGDIHFHINMYFSPISISFNKLIYLPKQKHFYSIIDHKIPYYSKQDNLKNKTHELRHVQFYIISHLSCRFYWLRVPLRFVFESVSSWHDVTWLSEINMYSSAPLSTHCDVLFTMTIFRQKLTMVFLEHRLKITCRTLRRFCLKPTFVVPLELPGFFNLSAPPICRVLFFWRLHFVPPTFLRVGYFREKQKQEKEMW